jgi:hypothetical protein
VAFRRRVNGRVFRYPSEGVRKRLAMAAGWVILVGAHCKPTTVADAEARGDVAWLKQNDSPSASAALGRLADKDPNAVAVLTLRSSYDLEAFRAAWAAVTRGAPWGTTLIHDALGDPKRADHAAAVMTKAGGRLPAFVPDLEAALVRLSATPQNVNVSTALASVGPPARAAVERRLVDASTRASMCVGIVAPHADDDARKALLGVPQAARDALSCVDAVVRVAADDEAALAWLATRGEPGLLGAAGKNPAMPCAQLHVAWVQAFATRPASDYPALTVPLGYAVTRCAPQMDGVLADAIVHLPAAHGVVVAAIDPFASYGDGLRATCAALPTIADGPDKPVVRERATDALFHACKPPG